MFPFTEQCLAQQKNEYPLTLLVRALENTDIRVQADKPVTPAFLFAALLWEPLRQLTEQLLAHGKTEIQAIQDASRQVLTEQTRYVMLPKRFSLRTRDIWHMQPRLQRNTSRRALLLLENPSFRAAYDFLLLRVEAGEELKDLADWWTQVQEVGGDERLALVGPSTKSRRPRRRRKKPKAQ
jgi:poly(A) polymerase